MKLEIINQYENLKNPIFNRIKSYLYKTKK